MARTTNRVSPAERRNRGYWDGLSARERGRLPVWDKSAVYRCRHPFDKPYGEGFWIGWYGEPAPPGAVIR
jgi:hypothetical protein